MIRKLHGTVHGRFIELTDDPGLADGQEVEVVVREADTTEPLDTPRQPGNGIRRSAGALAKAWTDEDDRILRYIADDRFRSSARELPE